MKKDGIYRAFIAAFLIICLLPLLALPIVGEAQPAANELPVPMPELWAGDGGLNTEYCSQLSDYIAASFAFRRQLVTAWSLLNARLLGSSAQEKLILGRQGWLFFSETLDDYMGVGLSDGLLESAANNVALMQEYAESQNAGFVFTVAPNKNSLYPQYMPRRIAENLSASNAARLERLLRERNVEYADLFSAFRGRQVLYYAGDSHWNSEGAAVAADCILSRCGRDSAYADSDFGPGQEHLGDLYEMLYPALPASETELVCRRDFDFQCLSDPAGGNAMRISTESPGGQGRLLCFRDSFGISLYPYLAQSFQNALFSRAVNYDLRDIDENGTDMVIIELVERNLDYLVDKAPCFQAPVRALQEERLGEGRVAVTCSEAQKGLVQLCGEFSADMCDPGSRVYLSDGIRVYEACVLRGGSEQSLRFSAWLEPGATVERMLCCNGGVLTAYAVFSE